MEMAGPGRVQCSLSRTPPRPGPTRDRGPLALIASEQDAGNAPPASRAPRFAIALLLPKPKQSINQSIDRLLLSPCPASPFSLPTRSTTSPLHPFVRFFTLSRLRVWFYFKFFSGDLSRSICWGLSTHEGFSSRYTSNLYFPRSKLL